MNVYTLNECNYNSSFSAYNTIQPQVNLQSDLLSQSSRFIPSTFGVPVYFCLNTNPHSSQNLQKVCYSYIHLSIQLSVSPLIYKLNMFTLKIGLHYDQHNHVILKVIINITNTNIAIHVLYLKLCYRISSPTLKYRKQTDAAFSTGSAAIKSSTCYRHWQQYTLVLVYN